MEGAVLVGLLLVDGCVSLCHLKGKQGILDLHCIPGHTINMPASLRRPPGGFTSCIRPLSDARGSLSFVLDALMTSKPQLPERMRPRCLGTSIHEALMAIKETREQGAKQLSISLARVFYPHCFTRLLSLSRRYG